MPFSLPSLPYVANAEVITASMWNTLASRSSAKSTPTASSGRVSTSEGRCASLRLSPPSIPAPSVSCSLRPSSLPPAQREGASRVSPSKYGIWILCKVNLARRSVASLSYDAALFLSGSHRQRRRQPPSPDQSHPRHQPSDRGTTGRHAVDCVPRPNRPGHFQPGRQVSVQRSRQPSGAAFAPLLDPATMPRVSCGFCPVTHHNSGQSELCPTGGYVPHQLGSGPMT